MKYRSLSAPVFVLLIQLLHAGPAAADDTPYQLGRGLTISDALIVGGYFSMEYANGDHFNELNIDDLALLAYGSFTNGFSYLAELESADFYIFDFENDTHVSHVPPIIERLYGDYTHSDYLSVRFGKQITPIGYWNLQPINVLRETTSNPLLSRQMFPQFLSGLDIYGYTPFDEHMTYHVYLQATKDLDNERINIDADSHYGLSLEKHVSDSWQLGGSAGRFTEVDDSKTWYLQLNSRLDEYRYSLITEATIDFRDPARGKSGQSQAFYLQGEYRFTPQHALIGRIEYFHDDIRRLKDRIGILGYSYRPVYPISLKVEYQWHADSHDDGVYSSFSILF